MDKNNLEINGLSDIEVNSRKEAGFINAVEMDVAKSNLQIFKDNAITLFNFYNLAIAIALLLVGAFKNVLFFLVVILNVSIGIFQEIRAKNLVKKLTLLTVHKTKVIRNGKEVEIDIDEIVLDDILVLEAGRQIPSDSIIVKGEIEVNESLLTGEADLIVKKESNELLSGSFVISGKCYARVKHVGADNFAVKIALGAKKHKGLNSEIIRSMRRVTNFTSFIVIPIGLILFAQAFFLRESAIDESIINSAAAILGMLPRGLVLLVSISLAVGVITLARKKILVQDIYAIETLAHVDLLCLDKTGTITEGKIRVTNFHQTDNVNLPFPAETALKLFVGASTDNNATFLALKEFFPTEKNETPLNSVSFSSDRKWSSVSFKEGTIIIGAPEKLALKQTNTFSDNFSNQSDARIIWAGFTKEVPSNNELPNLEVFAVIEMFDSIRENVAETLAMFKAEGVGVKIISGDNPQMVSQIAQKAGLEDYASFVDMSQYTTIEQVNKAAQKYTIFGRVTPNQKKELVAAFKANGNTVAFVGDGVNDILALREADCGIALKGGSEASTQVARIVLLDSDFKAISEILFEGRRVVNNITKIAGIFFIKTVYSVLLSLILIIMNVPFPFVPIQITLIDLAIEGYPSFFLSFERNKQKIEGTFLRTAFTNAIPMALMITINIVILLTIEHFSTIPQAEIITIIYLLTGFISVIEVFKSMRPYNKYRLFLAMTSGVGFFVAVYLFSEFIPLLYLTFPTGNNWWLFVILASISLPASLILSKIVKIISRKTDPKMKRSLS